MKKWNVVYLALYPVTILPLTIVICLLFCIWCAIDIVHCWFGKRINGHDEEEPDDSRIQKAT